MLIIKFILGFFVYCIGNLNNNAKYLELIFFVYVDTYYCLPV